MDYPESLPKLSAQGAQALTTDLTLAEYTTLVERGRQRALRMILDNPAARQRVEVAFGVEYAQRRYPEAYGLDRAPVYDEPPGYPAQPTTGQST